MKFSNLYNPFVRAILQSPIHDILSRSTLLLTFAGRRSGKQFTTPISYAFDGEMVTLITHRKHGWWKNFEEDAPVSVLMRGESRDGIAHLVPADTGVLIGAMIDVYHGITYEQAKKLAPDAVMIRVQLN
jgi:hypothetical protein